MKSQNFKSAMNRTKARSNGASTLRRLRDSTNLVKPRARNFPLFVYTANPKTASPRSPLRENVLPLAELRAMPTWGAHASYHDVVAFKSGVSKAEGARSGG